MIDSQGFDFDVEHVPGKLNFGPDLLSRAGARDCPVDNKTLNEINERTCMSLQFQNPEKDHNSDLILGKKYTQTSTCASCGLVSNNEDIPTARYMALKTLADAPILLDLKMWLKLQKEDPDVNKVRKILEVPVDTDDKASVQTHRYFSIKDSLVYFSPWSSKVKSPRAYVPTALRSSLLTLFHSNFGHRGVRPIVKMLATAVYWPKMRQYCADWIRACVACRRKQTPRQLRAGLTKPLMNRKPWIRLCIDFMHSPLPTSSEGFKYALVVICCFTRYPIVCCLKTTTSNEIATVLLRDVFTVFGLPHVVHSDNGRELISSALELVFAKLGIRRTTITFRHPSGNAPAERFIRYLNKSLSVTLPKYEDWPSYLPLVLYAYRVMVHTVTGHSPFYLNFGRDPVLPLSVALTPQPLMEPSRPSSDKAHAYVDKMLLRLKEAFIKVRHLQQEAHKKNAARRDADGRRYAVEFKADDLVLYWDPRDHLSTTCPPIRNTPEGVGPRAWRMCWTGPHKLTKKLGDNVYEIWHDRRHKTISCNVTDLVKYNPFADNVIARPNAIVDNVPITSTTTDDVPLKIGDLVIIILPDEYHTPEQMFVGRYLGDRKDSSNIDVQWHGSYKNYSTLEQTLKKKAWFPGWFQSSTLQFYWAKTPQSKTHSEYTNENSSHVIDRTQVLIYGFGLLKNHHLPSTIVDTVMERRPLWLKTQ